MRIRASCCSKTCSSAPVWKHTSMPARPAPTPGAGCFLPALPWGGLLLRASGNVSLLLESAPPAFMRIWGLLLLISSPHPLPFCLQPLEMGQIGPNLSFSQNSGLRLRGEGTVCTCPLCVPSTPSSCSHSSWTQWWPLLHLGFHDCLIYVWGGGEARPGPVRPYIWLISLC